MAENKPNQETLNLINQGVSLKKLIQFQKENSQLLQISANKRNY